MGVWRRTAVRRPDRDVDVGLQLLAGAGPARAGGCIEPAPSPRCAGGAGRGGGEATALRAEEVAQHTI